MICIEISPLFLLHYHHIPGQNTRARGHGTKLSSVFLDLIVNCASCSARVGTAQGDVETNVAIAAISEHGATIATTLRESSMPNAEVRTGPVNSGDPTYQAEIFVPQAW